MALLLRVNSTTHLYAVVVFVAAYLGLVNLTTAPESDLANYIQAPKDAEDLDIGAFLLFYSREPLYYFLLYYLGNIPLFDQRHYIFLSTFVPYAIFGCSIIKVSLKLRLDHSLILGLVLCLLFFPQLFNISAHLMRQFLCFLNPSFFLGKFLYLWADSV